jgi:hypothetical protein
MDWIRKMLDREMKTQGLCTTEHPLCILTAVALILAFLTGMSNTALGDATVVPYYDAGDKEDLPSAAARLCNLRCSQVGGGCAFTFDLEVFETCWTPVYALEICGLREDLVEPVSWPEGWKAGTIPSGLLQEGSMVFYTTDDPILPGSVRTGFGLMCYSGGTIIRWFPADEDGILIGKASRTKLSCPVGTEPSSWGSIKALYR